MWCRDRGHRQHQHTMQRHGSRAPSRTLPNPPEHPSVLPPTRTPSRTRGPHLVARFCGLDGPRRKVHELFARPHAVNVHVVEGAYVIGRGLPLGRRFAHESIRIRAVRHVHSNRRRVEHRLREVKWGVTGNTRASCERENHFHGIEIKFHGINRMVVNFTGSRLSMCLTLVMSK